VSAAESRLLRVFVLLCVAHGVALLGSHVTMFAIGVWLYQRTGSITAYALIGLANMLPLLLASPYAGILIDRRDRRVVLLGGYVACGVCSLGLAATFYYGALSLGTALPIVALASLSSTAQLPGLSATMTHLVPPSQLVRANGFLLFLVGLGQIVAPIAAGLLMEVWTLDRVILVDVASALLAIAIVASVRLPAALRTPAPAVRGALLDDMTYGLRYIWRRPGLRALLALGAVSNFVMSIVQALLTPLVLSFADAAALGAVLSTSGVGMLVGSIALTLAPPPRRAVRGILVSALLQSAMLFLGAARPSAALIAVGAFGFSFAVPWMNGYNQAIWQAIVPADVQGRVFATRGLLAQCAMPIGFVSAGPLADRVFEPAMRVGGPLASSAGWFIGAGPGRGVALIFAVLASVSTASILVICTRPSVRGVEDDAGAPLERSGLSQRA